MIKQCVIIFGCLALGELVVRLGHLPLPSSVIGMICLTIFLKLGWVKIAWVKELSDFLIKNLPIFFVPSGVAIMLHLDMIKAQFWPIFIASLLSTVIVLAITGWTHQITRKK